MSTLSFDGLGDDEPKQQEIEPAIIKEKSPEAASTIIDAFISKGETITPITVNNILKDAPSKYHTSDLDLKKERKSAQMDFGEDLPKIPKNPAVLKRELQEYLDGRLEKNIEAKEELSQLRLEDRIKVLVSACKLPYIDVLDFIPADIHPKEIFEQITKIEGSKAANQVAEKLISIIGVPEEFKDGFQLQFYNIKSELVLYNGHNFLHYKDYVVEQLTKTKHESGTYTKSVTTNNSPGNAAQIVSVSFGSTDPKPSLEPKADAINPSHYGYTPGVDNPYEVIKIIEHFNLGFCVGNVIKYLLRAGKKDGNPSLQDHKKALWYLNRRIKQLEDAEKTEQV